MIKPGCCRELLPYGGPHCTVSFSFLSSTVPWPSCSLLKYSHSKLWHEERHSWGWGSGNSKLEPRWSTGALAVTLGVGSVCWSTSLHSGTSEMGSTWGTCSLLIGMLAIIWGGVSWLWPSATLTNAFPSPQHHSWAHKLTPETLHSFPTQSTHSWSYSITPDPIACTYLLLVLVPCLLLPHICYSTSTLFPLSVSLSSPSPSTLYHLTLSCLPAYPHYILHFSPYIQSPIPNLFHYVFLSTHSISSRTLVSSPSVW